MSTYRQSERKTIVPWFSMSEWDITYKFAYSGNADLQLSAYERMLVWKARSERLPIGVECTMGMLHVLVKDKELVSKLSNGFLLPHQEYDLRLLYSTAIMRFLNQIAVLTQTSTDTLYHAARKMHVPDWLVGLRHEIAHGANVPPLILLRKAAQFALNWLHEYYWKGEAAASADFVITKPDSGLGEVAEDIKELFEIWEAVNLYILSGYRKLGEIPDRALRAHIKKVIYDWVQGSDGTNAPVQNQENEDENILNDENDDENIQNDDENIQNDDDEDLQNIDENLEEDGNSANDTNVNNENQADVENQSEAEYVPCNDDNQNDLDEIDLLSLKILSLHVIGKLMPIMRKYRTSHEICNQITQVILSGQLLLPPFSVYRLLRSKPEGREQLPAPLKAIWNPIITYIVPIVNFLPALVRGIQDKVIDTELAVHQNWLAAAWLKEIFSSFIKTRMIHKYLYSDFGLTPTSRVPKALWVRAEKLAAKNRVYLSESISLKIARFPEPFMSLNDVKKILLSPNNWTNLYLPRILEYFDLSPAKAEHILQLLDIYTKYQDVNDVDAEKDSEEEHIHTVEDLIEKLPSQFPRSDDVKENESVEVNENGTQLWKRCEDVNWAKCPLGVLPWQTDKNMLELDFDTSVTWNSTKEQNTQLPKELIVSELPSEISWDKVLKKRIKRGRVEKQKRKMKNLAKITAKMLFGGPCSYLQYCNSNKL